MIQVALAQRFARLATTAVVRQPFLWRFFRSPIRREFDALAPGWEKRVRPEGLAPLEGALAGLQQAPRRALDVGTGTGRAAFLLARRFQEAEVVAVDLAPRMVAEASRLVPPELAGRIDFGVADAAALPYADGSFDLVVQANVIPFFDELARVVASGGTVVFVFSLGERTPIYVPFDRLRAELGRRGFAEFAELSAGAGSALTARKR